MARVFGVIQQRYRLERELGRGSFGAVYAAVDQATGDRVALKLLARFDAGEGARRFRREMEIVARIPPHPNVVRVLGSGKHGSLPFVVFELVTGGTLAAALLRAGRPPLARAVTLVASLGDALAHLHGHGVVHRDVTGPNVLLDAAGEPKLADLGLSLDLERDTRVTDQGEVAGSLQAIAPEQLGGDGEIGRAVDIWGAASLLHELIAGRRPFGEASSFSELARLIRTRTPEPLDSLGLGVPPSLARLVERGLSRRPEGRPTASELARLLREEAIRLG